MWGLEKKGKWDWDYLLIVRILGLLFFLNKLDFILFDILRICFKVGLKIYNVKKVKILFINLVKI